MLLLIWIAAASIYRQFETWIYLLAYAGTSIAFYVVYAAMMRHFQDYFVHLVYYQLQDEEAEAEQ